MPAYVVASIEITDPEGYQRYLPGSAAAIRAYGGEVLAADQATEVLEGPARPLTVILRFPDKTTADAWYRSPEYQGVVHIRHENGEGTMVIADGFVPPAG
jgi:uncharacterized protein (DUF1330 family)